MCKHFLCLLFIQKLFYIFLVEEKNIDNFFCGSSERMSVVWTTIGSALID